MDVAIVGAGLIGRKRAVACLEMPEIDDVYVFDVNSSQSQGIHQLDPKRVHVVESVDQILNMRSLASVIVATTHSSLGPLARLMIEHDKNVLIEKPGGLNLADVHKLASATQTHRGVVRFGFNHRFHPAFLLAKSLVGRGEFGDVLWIRGQYGHGGRIGYESEWRANRQVSGGGELLDQGSHLIDLTQFLVGTCELAYSNLRTMFWKMDVEDNAFFTLKNQNGVVAWHHASWTEWKNRFSFEITMRSAKIEIVGLGGSYGKEQLVLYEMDETMRPPKATHFSWDSVDMSWNLEMRDFVQATRGERGHGATLSEVIDLFNIVNSAYST